MNWADSAAAAATIETLESKRWDLRKAVPVQAEEVATGIFALDWLQPDGMHVHQLIDLRGKGPRAYLEVDPCPPPPTS